MSIVLFSDDLMITSQVEGAARETGAQFHAVSSAKAALGQVEASAANLIILDLSCSSVDSASLVPQLKEIPVPPRVIAFGPHVHAEKLAAAQDAGCDQVLSRGQFFSQLAEVLK